MSLFSSNDELTSCPNSLTPPISSKNIPSNPSSLSDISSVPSPPPYSPPSMINEDRSEFDNILYKKMLSLESMVSDIHGTVIDQSSSYKDISIQLKEIKDSMNLFHKEASIRIRDKLTKKSPLNSIFQTSPEQGEPLSSQENTSNDHEKEESVRYDRVCSLLENLIKDASDVLDTSEPEISQPFPDPEETPTKLPLHDITDISSASVPGSINSASEAYPDEDITEDSGNEKLDVKFFCQISQGETLIQRRELSRRMILPFLKEEVDVERLALLPSNENSQNREVVLSSSQSTELQKILLDNSSQKIISLIYWVIMFTLGSVFFDSSLCNTAGVQVLRLLDTLSKQSTHSRKRSLTITAPNSATPLTPNMSSQSPEPKLVNFRRKSV